MNQERSGGFGQDPGYQNRRLPALALVTATAFAGYGTGNRTLALVRYKNESINRLVILFQKPIKNIVLPLKILRDKRNTAIRKQNVICHCTATTPKLSATFVLGQISALK